MKKADKENIYWLGEGLQNLNQKQYSLLMSKFNLIECGNEIKYLSRSTSNYFFYFIGEKPDPQLQKIIKLCEKQNKQLIVIKKNRSQCKSLIPLHIIAELNQSDKNISEDWVTRIANEYFLDYESKDRHLSKKSSDIMQLNHKYSKMVSKYINDNIKKKLKEDQVAALCHYSPNHFSRLFHQTFGICFRDYVTELRISLAKKLLLKDSTKVSYIAYQCGYKDASYFGRIFKKKTGFSPANYRKKLINPN